MAQTQNPFKPGAGPVPPDTLERADELQQIQEGILNGPGAPRAFLVSGARGIGKTVLLTEARQQAEQLGWVTFSATATSSPGQIIRDLQSKLTDYEASPLYKKLPKLTGAQAAGIGLTMDWPSPPSGDTLESRLTRLAVGLGKKNRGILITVDEIQASDKATLEELAAISQSMTTQGLPVAIVLAGIHAGIQRLLDTKSAATFLRRAEPIFLGSIRSARAVLDSYRRVFHDNGRPVDEDQLKVMTAATQGYPYMVQLVGYQVWSRYDTDSMGITQEALAEALSAARRRLGQNVIAPELANLSAVSKTFLLHMSKDEGASSVADLQARLGVDKTYVQTYKRRLLAEGVIKEAGRGQLDFVLPYMRDYLRAEAASRIAEESFDTIAGGYELKSIEAGQEG